jgi:hypothetical protein
MRLALRSLALLEYAVEQAEEDELKSKASFALLESCLDTGHWERAEAIFPAARSQLTAGEVADWYGRIAAAAARSGAKADAMRIWTRAANLDLTSVSAVEQLLGAGLRDELISFYESLLQSIPQSEVPARMLARLQ